jgi:hypothetical protein
MPGENRADFLRASVERELRRRERKASADGKAKQALDGDR